MAKETTFDVLIEIPKGSRNKYEYDFDLGKMRFDRMLHTSMVYPTDYGFIPETLADDGDPLDVLVISTIPFFPGCVVEVKPVGILYMSDEKGGDEKVLCMPKADPMVKSLNELNQVNPHLTKEIEHFFKVYKDLENKKVEVRGWGDAQKALEVYEECIARYKGQSAKKFVL